MVTLTGDTDVGKAIGATVGETVGGTAEATDGATIGYEIASDADGDKVRDKIAGSQTEKRSQQSKTLQGAKLWKGWGNSKL